MKNSDTKKSVILTIDDEKHIRDSFKFFLEDNNYKILEAENGKDGLELYEKENPDLILVDLHMPVVDGFTVLREITKKSPDLPIIVVSGNGIIGDVVKAVHIGAWDYILKPVEDFSVLLHSVEKGLERVRLLKENREYQENLEKKVEIRTRDLKIANKKL